MAEGEQALRAHLAGGRFLAGAARGRWRLIELRWPVALIEVAARDERRFVLRFECTGYPQQAPTATLWDMNKQQPLEASRWPRGGRVSQVFNHGWRGGMALYLPCDREALPGHGNWVHEHPWLIWKPERGLLQYIEAVCELLQSHELVATPA